MDEVGAALDEVVCPAISCLYADTLRVNGSRESDKAELWLRGVIDVGLSLPLHAHAPHRYTAKGRLTDTPANLFPSRAPARGSLSRSADANTEPAVAADSRGK